MQYRSLGKTAISVSEISHGTWAMGFMWGKRDDDSALKALKKSIELGVNFIDTAYLYGNGHSERLIAKAIQGNPNKIWVATKCPPKTKAWPPKPGTLAREAFPREHLIQTTEASLKNLGQDCLDLQQLHVWRKEWLQEEEWKETITNLKSQGKIRYFGISLNDHDVESGFSLVESGLVDSIQLIFNLFDQRPREKLFSLCQQKEIGILVRVPLDEGGLSGTLSPQIQFPKGDWRKQYFKGDRLRKTYEHARQFSFLIRKEIKSLPQAAIKFCLSESAVSTVIVGMRSINHVEENVAVPDLSGFTDQELSRIYELAWPRNYYPTFP